MTAASAVHVVVQPERFTLVNYDAAEIARLVAEAASWVGLGSADSVVVNVDEGSPLGVVSLASVDPIVVHAEGGAFENPKRIRELDPLLVQIATVRVLARAADRRLPGFADAPDEASLGVAEADCWDAWALGRAARRGLAVPQQRWRYRFHNRHGFTDVADRVFDRLWAAPTVTWAEIDAACAETAAARPAVA